MNAETVVYNRPPSGFSYFESYGPYSPDLANPLYGDSTIVTALTFHVTVIETPVRLAGYRSLLMETLPTGTAYEARRMRIALYRSDGLSGLPASIVAGSMTAVFCPAATTVGGIYGARRSVMGTNVLDVPVPDTSGVSLVPGPYSIAVLWDRATPANVDDRLRHAGTSVQGVCRDMRWTDLISLPSVANMSAPNPFPTDITPAKLANILAADRALSPGSVEWGLLVNYV